MKIKILTLLAIVFVFTMAVSCDKEEDSATEITKDIDSEDIIEDNNENAEGIGFKEESMGKNTSVIFLHHSTGELIWNGGMLDYINDYNNKNKTSYSFFEQSFPKEAPYGWENYPYDYWNIWVNNGDEDNYMSEPTLRTLTKEYDVIVFKHCFPVSMIEESAIYGEIDSSEKTLPNYKLQYEALKAKMNEFPKNRFIVWTGPALIQGETTKEQAERAKEWREWVVDEWDVKGDNIFLWDFYDFETDGELYMKDLYSQGDSHPSESFSLKISPYFAYRVINVIEGKGDSTSITGE